MLNMLLVSAFMVVQGVESFFEEGSTGMNSALCFTEFLLTSIKITTLNMTVKMGSELRFFFFCTMSSMFLVHFSCFFSF